MMLVGEDDASEKSENVRKIRTFSGSFGDRSGIVWGSFGDCLGVVRGLFAGCLHFIRTTWHRLLR